MKAKKPTKGYVIKARVSQRIKDAVVAAAAHGEAEAVVIREALGNTSLNAGSFRLLSLLIQPTPNIPRRIAPARNATRTTAPINPTIFLDVTPRACAPSKPHEP